MPIAIGGQNDNVHACVDATPRASAPWGRNVAPFERWWGGGGGHAQWRCKHCNKRKETPARRGGERLPTYQRRPHPLPSSPCGGGVLLLLCPDGGGGTAQHIHAYPRPTATRVGASAPAPSSTRSVDRPTATCRCPVSCSLYFFPLLSRPHRQWTAPPTRGLRCTPHATAVAIHRRRHGHTVPRNTRTRGEKNEEIGRAEEHKSREDVRCRWRGGRRQPAHAPTGRPTPDRPSRGNRRGSGGRGGGCQVGHCQPP